MGQKEDSRHGNHWREPSRNESRRRFPDDFFLPSPHPKKKPSRLIEPIPDTSHWITPAPPPPPLPYQVPMHHPFSKAIRVVLVFLMMIFGNAVLWIASRLAVALLLPTDPHAYFAVPFLVCFGMNVVVLNYFSENRTRESGDAKLLAVAIAFFINSMLVLLLALAEKSVRLGL